MSEPLSQEGALHEAVEKAEAEIVASVSNAVLVSGRPLGVILRDLYRGGPAQVSALESVAKEQCKYCWDGRRVVRAVDGLWWHEGVRHVGCHSGTILDALSLLRFEPVGR